MILIDQNGPDYIEEIQELIEVGEELLFVINNTKYLVSREGTNNKYAMIQNCVDGEIEQFHIVSETEELFGDAECYTDISMTISVK